jgi:hypothetical protein
VGRDAPHRYREPGDVPPDLAGTVRKLALSDAPCNNATPSFDMSVAEGPALTPNVLGLPSFPAEPAGRPDRYAA